MEKNNEVLVDLIFLMLISYIVTFALCGVFSIFFLGFIEPVFIVIGGIINSIFIRKFLNTNVLKSILLGFTISAFSLLLIFCLWHLKIINSTIGVLLFIGFSILILALLKKHENRVRSFKNLFLFIFISISLMSVFSLKNFYPNENRHIEKYTFKVVDIHGNPVIGDSVEVSILRQPMFNLQEIHKKNNLITNQKGEFTVLLSKSTNYEIRIYDNENRWKESFQIEANTQEINLTLSIKK